MSKSIWESYKANVIRKYGQIDIQRFSCILADETLELNSIPANKLYVDVKFKEYKTPNEREKQPRYIVNNSDNKVILSDIGGGKTSFLKFLLTQKINGRVVPVFWEWADLHDKIDSGRDFHSIVSDYIKNHIDENYSLKDIKDFIRQKNFVYIIDKFDKIPLPDSKVSIEKILGSIHHVHFQKRYFVIAARLGSFSKQSYNFFKRKKFMPYTITPLDDELIPNYIDKYVAHIASGLKKKKTSQLLEDIKSHSSVRKLAQNPFLLNSMLSLYLRDGTKPPTKETLYEKCIELLLGEWLKTRDDEKIFQGTLKLEGSDLINMMSKIANEYYHFFVSRKKREYGILSKAELRRIVTKIYKDLAKELGMDKEQAVKAVESLFPYFEQNDIGVIVEKSSGKYGFFNDVLLEYLSAKHLEINYSGFEEGLNFITEIVEHPKFKAVEDTIIFLIIMLSMTNKAKFINLLAKRLLSLYKSNNNDESKNQDTDPNDGLINRDAKQPEKVGSKDHQKNILFLLAKLLKDSEQFPVECAGEILNSLAVYKLNNPNTDDDIMPLIHDIYAFSKTVKQQFVKLVRLLKEEKKKMMSFSEKAMYFTKDKAKEIKKELGLNSQQGQDLGIIENLPGLRDTVKKVREQLELLENILNKFQDQAHEEEIKYKKYILSQLIMEAVDEVMTSEKFPNVEVKYQFGESGDTKILINKDPLIEIIRELIKNSYKHSQSDPIKIIISLEPDKSDSSKISLCFKDNGKGIPDGIRQRIFEPFYPTDGNSHGMGLAKVKKLIETLDGEINVESEINKGAMFRLTLQLN